MAPESGTTCPEDVKVAVGPRHVQIEYAQQAPAPAGQSPSFFPPPAGLQRACPLACFAEPAGAFPNMAHSCPALAQKAVQARHNTSCNLSCPAWCLRSAGPKREWVFVLPKPVNLLDQAGRLQCQVTAKGLLFLELPLEAAPEAAAAAEREGGAGQAEEEGGAERAGEEAGTA